MIRTEIHRDADYGILLTRQRDLFAAMVERRRASRPLDDEVLMLVEHKPVYTVGRHGKLSNIIHPEYLRSRGAELFEIERGGDVTFHGPGQLVAYLLIDLQSRHIGVKEFVWRLEEAVIHTIAEYGVKGERIEGATGVWIGPNTSRERKICAIGIKCSRFVTMHGLALNVTTDPTWFSAINPCGFTDKPVTTLAAETGSQPSWEEVADRLQAHLLSLLA